MRFALISDIHGNTVALDAVLTEMSARRIDLIVCLGDIAASGPDPVGAIDRVAELDAVVVQGNTDAGMVDVPAWWRDPSLINASEPTARGLEMAAWTADQLSADHTRYLDALPLTAEIELPGVGQMLAFHGSPQTADDLITATTPDDELEIMLDGASQPVLAGGHTHVQLVRRFARQTIVNAGSVGMPFARYGFAGAVGVLPHAEYAVVNVEDGRVGFELIQTGVDEQRLAADARRRDMPHTEWWLGLRETP